MITEISIKNDFIGYHSYKMAPEDVLFLRSLHRHHFIVTTTISVKHNDREIEFFELQNEIDKRVKEIYPNATDISLVPGIIVESCENFARDIVSYLDFKYPGRYVSCEVSEDNECSGIVIKDANEQFR